MAERKPLDQILGFLNEIALGDSLKGVREVPLTGLVNLTGNVLATDSVLVAIGKLTNNQQSQTLTTTTSVLDFSPAVSNVQIILTTANTTFTTVNLAYGQRKDVFITTNSTVNLYTLTFPTGWVFYGTKPTAVVIGKEIRLRMVCYGTSDANVRAESITQG